MTQQIPTSEVLNKAADLIQRRGWTTGNGGRANIGDPSAPLCLEGGILAASGIAEYDTAAWRAAEECPAARAVHNYLGLSTHERLWEWNDAWYGAGISLRTPEQVIEVLRATAVIEAAREEQAAAELTYAENLAVSA